MAMVFKGFLTLGVFVQLMTSFLQTKTNSYQVPINTNRIATIPVKVHPLRSSSTSDQIDIPTKRTPLIAGNWKMNTDKNSATSLAKEISELTKDAKDVEIAVIPPFTFISDVKQTLSPKSKNIFKRILSKVFSRSRSLVKVGAQNCYYESKGAFTGAISASMLSSLGCDYVLVGHSERRITFKDSDDDINRITKSILLNNMIPILCIGETKEEYELGLNEEVCTLQLSKGLQGITPEDVAKIVIAYEPVWAIGTGLSATPKIAQNVHAAIRKWLRNNYSDEIADSIRIQYGGSVTPETVDELMKCPDIDGALVGGASLTAKSFARIVNFNK
eukprot:gene9774-13149_t